jgi:hypothetical protein
MVDVMCHGAAKLGQRWWMSCVMELLNWDNFIVLIHTVDSTPKKRFALLQKQNSFPSMDGNTAPYT